MAGLACPTLDLSRPGVGTKKHSPYWTPLHIRISRYVTSPANRSSWPCRTTWLKATDQFYDSLHRIGGQYWSLPGGLLSVVYGSKHWWLGSYVQDLGSPKVWQYHYLSDILTTLIYTVETDAWSALKKFSKMRSFSFHLSNRYFNYKQTSSKTVHILTIPWSNFAEASFRFCQYHREKVSNHDNKKVSAK